MQHLYTVQHALFLTVQQTVAMLATRKFINSHTTQSTLQRKSHLLSAPRSIYSVVIQYRPSSAYYTGHTCISSSLLHTGHTNVRPYTDSTSRGDNRQYDERILSSVRLQMLSSEDEKLRHRVARENLCILKKGSN